MKINCHVSGFAAIQALMITKWNAESAIRQLKDR